MRWTPLAIPAPVRISLLETEEWLDGNAICGLSHGLKPILRCQGPVGAAPQSAATVCHYAGGIEIEGSNGRAIFIATGASRATLHIEGVACDTRVARRNYRPAA